MIMQKDIYEKKAIAGQQGLPQRLDKGAAFVHPTEQELRAKLTPLQYRVTQCNATERPFANSYWDNKRPGIYVDIISGVPLFSSTHQFASTSGWPSFTQVIKATDITLHDDYTLSYKRTEVRSRLADSHLGHVFTDGLPPTGLRYCINSAALKFIEKNALKELGYGDLMKLFN